MIPTTPTREDTLRPTVWLFPALIAAWLLLAGCLAAAADAENGGVAEAGGRTFYVDSESGDDAAEGHSPQTAWQSLERVNGGEFQPGDTIRFKSGGTWRGSLVPASGSPNAPVTYAAYGTGAKPRLLGSRPRHRPEDWVQVRENVWATLPMEYRLGEQLLDLRGSRWNHHQEAGAKIELKMVEEQGEPLVRIASFGSGSAANHVQLWGPELPVQAGDCLVMTFRARSNRPLQLPGFTILLGTNPWTRFASSSSPGRPLGAEWDSYQVAFEVSHSADAGRLHLSLGGLLPEGTVVEIQPQTLHAATPSIADPLSADVGNIIFDDGAVCGWKKWSLDELTRSYDYYYERSSQRVYLYSQSAPPDRHKSIELALGRHIVNQSGKHHVVYDGLALLYGAAHGFGGGNTHDLVIRNCDLGYIGEAHQLTRSDGKPVRYGNAIEFWGAARDNLVEGCRIWEVYDAALTNQGRSPDSHQINITYRNNVIWNSEYSFEYWNHPETAVTRNIRFLNNTCVGAGRGWAHAQRPDPNGSHLMFYSNTADTSDFEVKYNIFYDHTDWGSRYTGGWQVLPDIDYNLWYSASGVMCYWFRDKLAGFDEYRRTTGLDDHSRFADPQFQDPANGDYRLRADSPARSLGADQRAAGAKLP